MLPPEEMRFYSPYSETAVGQNRLPHWDQQGCSYALTFRLADSVPASQLHQHQLDEKNWRLGHPDPWSPEVALQYHRQFTGAIERWLDQGVGECLLHRPGCAQIVSEALQFFEGERTRLHAWVVMPNHVHALAEVFPGHTLPAIMNSWKGFTARAINRQLNRTGTLWQKSYHDRLIRDWDHFGNVVRYIRRNPAMANIPRSSCPAGESELAATF